MSYDLQFPNTSVSQPESEFDLSFAPPQSPPTPEQVFSSTFADVSGRDPLSTALSQRTPAQNLANYMVEQYLTNPQIVTKPVQINLGELETLKLGSMHWIEPDDRDPLFKMGRWAQILGKSGTGDPSDPVDLELRICDNEESFVGPT